MSLAIKQRLMSVGVNSLPNDCNEEIRSSFRLLRDDYGLNKNQLKRYSHKQRTRIASSSESGSLKDLVMEHALKRIQEGTSALTVNGQTDLEAYEGMLSTNQEKALAALLATKEYNPHVQTIVESHVKIYLNNRKNGDTEEEEEQDEEYPPRRAFLKKMKEVRFNAVPSKKKAPKEMSWIINMMTQFDDPASADALFSLLCNDKEVSSLACDCFLGQP